MGRGFYDLCPFFIGKMMVKIVLIPIVLLCSSSLLFGAMPPETVKRLNSEAQEVLIGEVLDIKNAPYEWCERERLPEESICKYFLLRVEHVFKSNSAKKEGGLVKVRFVEYLTPIRGPRLVRVEIGRLVIIYANQVQFDENVLIPAAAGDSVITIGLPFNR